MFDKDTLNRLYRYAFSLTADQDTAYDLLQSALEKYLKKAPGNIDKPMAYIKIIIRNQFFDGERHRKSVPMLSMESDEIPHIQAIDDADFGQLLIRQQDVHILTENLSTRDNELLYLWAVEEHSCSEIAVIYQQPRGTVLSHLHRLKKRIRQHAKIIGMTAETKS